VKILMITQDFAPARGGIQTYSVQLSTHLRALGHEVLVVAPGQATAPIEGVQRIPIRDPIFLGLFLLWKLPRILKQFTPDLILHMQWMVSLASIIHCSQKQITLVHGRELVKYPLFQPVMRWALNRQAMLIANSHAVKTLTSRYTSADVPIYVVHPGVDSGRFTPQNKDEIRLSHGIPWNATVILNITRQVVRKNTMSLLRAFNAIASQNQDLLLIIGGTGPASPQIQDAIRQSPYKDRIRYLGYVPEDQLVEWYNVADVFCMPVLDQEGDLEGFGIVFLEAAACGVPSIATKAGGIPDAVLDGETGILVVPSSLIQLEVALQRICGDHSYRKMLGQKALERARTNFSWNQVAQRIEALF